MSEDRGQIIIEPRDYSTRPIPGQLSMGRPLPGEVNVYPLQPVDINSNKE